MTTIIKVKPDLVKPEHCEDCPFFVSYDVTEYGELSGDACFSCGISEDIEWKQCSAYEMEEESEKFLEKCPIISYERN